MSLEPKKTGGEEHKAVTETEVKAMKSTIEPKSADIAVPVILDAGSQSRKSIRRLKRGAGRLMREVNDTVEEFCSRSPVPTGTVVPVVVIYRQKRSRRNRLAGIVPNPLSIFR